MFGSSAKKTSSLILLQPYLLHAQELLTWLLRKGNDLPLTGTRICHAGVRKLSKACSFILGPCVHVADKHSESLMLSVIESVS